MELRRNIHHVFRIMYHFVWIPKYRHKIFVEPYRESLKLIIKKIGYDYNIEIVELEIPSDHVHMIVKSEPKVSPSDIMQIIKSIANPIELYHIQNGNMHQYAIAKALIL